MIERLDHLDEAGLALNTASVLAHNNAEVAALTPALTPRVADDPVLGGAGLAPADSNDSVVGGSGALGGRDDTLLVGLELVGIDSNIDSTVVNNGLLDGIDRLGDVSPRGNLRLNLLGVELAAALLGLVGISRVEHDTLLGIFSCHFSPATIAAIALLVAIDNLLLREHRRSLLVLLGIVDGHHTSGTKCPAGTALTLVTDSRNPLLLASIEGSRKSSNLLLSGLRLRLTLNRIVNIGEDLLRETVRKMSHAVLSIITSSIELSSKSHVLVEDLIATLFLGIMLIGLAEGGLVCLPEGIGLEGHGAGSSSEKGDCINSLHVDKYKKQPSKLKKGKKNKNNQT